MNGLTSVVFTSQSVTENLFTSNEFIKMPYAGLMIFQRHRPDGCTVKLIRNKISDICFRELLNIDYGTLVTYSQIAKDGIGLWTYRVLCPVSRAGGGEKYIAIIIPCHRVCGATITYRVCLGS